MSDPGDSDAASVRLSLGDSVDVDEVVLGFRKNGEYYELAAVSPPVTAHVERR